MAMQMLQNGEALRTNYTLAPTTINIGGKTKPYNDWTWGQVPDVFMNDCYYEELLAACITFDPTPLLLFQKPTYTYASAQVTALACEPNPMHMILYSCSFLVSGTNFFWPFAPPAGKRIEVYYALAGGARGWRIGGIYPIRRTTVWAAALLTLWRCGRRSGYWGPKLRRPNRCW